MTLRISLATLLPLIMLSLCSAQEIFVTTNKPGRTLGRFDLGSQSSEIIYTGKRIVDFSTNPIDRTVFALEGTSNKLLISNAISGFTTYDLPEFEPKSIRVSPDNNAFITFENGNGYLFNQQSETFDLIISDASSPIFPCGDYISFQNNQEEIIILQSSTLMGLDTISRFRDELKTAYYSVDSAKIILVSTLFSFSDISSFKPLIDERPTLLAETRHDRPLFRSHNSLQGLYVYERALGGSYELSKFNFNTLGFQVLGVNIRANVFDIWNEEETEFMIDTDNYLGQLVLKNFTTESDTAYLENPLANPKGLRYDSHCDCVYVINGSTNGSNGGSVYSIPLEPADEAKVIVPAKPQGAAKRLSAFEVDKNGNLLIAYEEEPIVYRRNCPTCPPEAIEATNPFLRTISGIATGHSDTIYLTNGTFAFKLLDGEVFEDFSTSLSSDGGDVRINQEENIFYSFQEIDNILKTYNTRTGISERLNIEISSSIIGITREDEGSGLVYAMLYSNADGDFSIYGIDLSTGNSSLITRYQGSGGPIALKQNRTSNAWESQTLSKDFTISLSHSRQLTLHTADRNLNFAICNSNGIEYWRSDRNLNKTTEKIEIDASNFPSGIYIVFPIETIGKAKIISLH